MDIEKNKKKQSLKVIISEAIMVLAVVVTVAILALVVSGYWVNSDFKVEQNGMLQISSVPTGANVNIDGEASSWLQRTNTSKILSSGEHTVTLSKDGYDTWSKTINVPEGPFALSAAILATKGAEKRTNCYGGHLRNYFARWRALAAC